MRAFAQTFCLLLLCVSLQACVKKPVYLPPSFEENFGKNDSRYLSIKPTIDRVIIQSADTSTWYEDTKEQQEQFQKADEQLRALSNAGHIPSLHLAGMYLLAQYQGYFGAGGYNGKFKKHYKKWGTQEKIDVLFNSHLDSAIQLFTVAARFGYPESIATLKQMDITPPAKDLQTPAERAASAKYQQDMQRYQDQGKQIAGAILGAIAVGAAAYAAAQSPGGSSGGSSYPTVAFADPDNRGCCSWHKGVAKDAFGNVKCHFLGNILCNDGMASPTCECA